MRLLADLALRLQSDYLSGQAENSEVKDWCEDLLARIVLMIDLAGAEQ